MTVAIVTGAARGIGAAIALRIAEEVDRVVLVDMSAHLAETATSIEATGTEVTPVQVDLTEEDGIEQTLVAVGGESLGAVVNNAGITRDARLVNMTLPDFKAVVDVNLGAPYRLLNAVADRFAAGAGVVNIASRAYLGNFGQFNYSISKGGLVGLTRSLSIELAPNVRVNAIAPGLIGTEMAMGIPDEIREKMINAIPLARMGKPEEVAELAAFLAFDRSQYITGQVVVIGGGRSLT